MALESLIIHEHRAVGEALALAIDAQPDLRCVGTATDLSSAMRLLDERHADVAVVSAATSLDYASHLRDVSGIRTVVIAEEVDLTLVRQAEEAGAVALLSRDSAVEDLVAAIRISSSGRLLIDSSTVLRLFEQCAGTVDLPESDPPELAASFTRRELEVLTLLGEGHDPQQIAQKLYLSVHTARGHVKSIMVKLGAHTQLQAVVMAAHEGLLPQFASSRR